MANFYATYPGTGGGSGVNTYANLAAFPSAVTAGNGALAIALDTDILYVSNGTVWEVLADPAFTPTDYFKLGGRSGGQIGDGGTGAGQNLTFSSTANATKGHVYLNAAQTSGLDEVNNFFGINVASPGARLHVNSSTNVLDAAIVNSASKGAFPANLLPGVPNCLGISVGNDNTFTYFFADFILPSNAAQRFTKVDSTWGQSGNTAIQLLKPTDSAGSGYGVLESVFHSGLLLSTFGTGNAILFWPNRSEMARMDTTGMSVGGFAPNCTFETINYARFKGSAGASTGVPTTGAGVEITYDSTSDTGFLYSYSRTAAGYKKLKIDSSSLYLNTAVGSGRVGIGTISPDETLQIAGALKVTGALATNTASSSGFDFEVGGNNGRIVCWGPDASTKAGFQIFLITSNASSAITPFAITPAGLTTITGPLTVTGTTTLATSLTGFLKAASGVVSTGTISLTSDVTGVLPTANGGTGQNSSATFPASGVVVTEAATETLTNKTISGASNTITNVSLTAGVIGTLPIGNGGTGQTTANPAFNALSPLTTKGDIVAFSTVNARLPVGSNGQALLADSTQTLGIKWGAVATAPTSQVQVNTGNGAGSTNTTVKRYTNLSVNTGSNITYADSATLGATFTINATGVYSCFASAKAIGVGAGFLISVNQNTSLGANGASTFASGGSANCPQIIAYGEIPVSTTFYSIEGTFRLTSGDVVRVLCDTITNGDSREIVCITQVA